MLEHLKELNIVGAVCGMWRGGAERARGAQLEKSEKFSGAILCNV